MLTSALSALIIILAGTICLAIAFVELIQNHRHHHFLQNNAKRWSEYS